MKNRLAIILVLLVVLTAPLALLGWQLGRHGSLDIPGGIVLTKGTVWAEMRDDSQAKESAIKRLDAKIQALEEEKAQLRIAKPRLGQTWVISLIGDRHCYSVYYDAQGSNPRPANNYTQNGRANFLPNEGIWRVSFDGYRRFDGENSFGRAPDLDSSWLVNDTTGAFLPERGNARTFDQGNASRR